MGTHVAATGPMWPGSRLGAKAPKSFFLRRFGVQLLQSGGRVETAWGWGGGLRLPGWVGRWVGWPQLARPPNPPPSGVTGQWLTPLLGGHSRSIPQGMILDVQPLVKSLFCPTKQSPNVFFYFEASIPLKLDLNLNLGGGEGGVRSLWFEGFEPGLSIKRSQGPIG